MAYTRITLNVVRKHIYIYVIEEIMLDDVANCE